MDPPSPSKLAMSPGMPIFPVSPERAVGTRPPYGEPPQMSPSTPVLRPGSPLRNAHRRNDSDVSVTGLATMFENLEVKDPREASLRFKAALEKEKVRTNEKLNKLEKEFARREKEHEIALDRRNVRIEELQSELETAKSDLQSGVTKAQYEKERKAHKANVGQWEKVFKQNEDKWRNTQANLTESNLHSKAYEGKYREYKKKWMELNKENLRASSMIPTLQTKIQGLQRTLQRAESDVKFKSEQATLYQNQVYGLQVELESVLAQLGEEVATMKGKLALVEGERDALKTSLKEEELVRVVAAGHIALPFATNDEGDEIESSIKSPRKQRHVSQSEDDKENVAPMKGAVELRCLQQELAMEKRLRERAQEQIDFMKMECQFQCCSCRIAEDKGKQYTHDNLYASEMRRIKSTAMADTPPSSNQIAMRKEDIFDQQILAEAQRPFTPHSEVFSTPEPEVGFTEQPQDDTVLVHPEANQAETMVTFSPNTGTFRAIPSPVKATAPVVISIPTKTPISPPQSSPWTPDAHSTTIAPEPLLKPALQPEVRAETVHVDRKDNKSITISVHKDLPTEDEQQDARPPTLSHELHGPATPYFTRTITTTTTIPIHFSPATPAFKPGRGPMTPSTVAHAPQDAKTPVLGELSLNNLPFDREAALEAIRQRRGRARSMAAGHGTPMKQMVQGTKDRRDISAPVSRVRR